MIQAIKYKLSGLLKREDQRSDKILKNVILSFGVKAGSILVGLLLVPLTINYINPVQYRIWLTISSVVSWMSFFDIGMGNGLRNKLAAAIALGEYDKAKKYVSTTYLLLSFIAAGVFLLFLILSPLFDWNSILNIPVTINENIRLIITIVIGAFCMQFVVQLINVVLTALHEPALAGLISFIGQLALLIGILILKQLVPGSLHVLVWLLTLIPLSVLLIASLYLYRTTLKGVAPEIKKIDIRQAGGILNTGSIFFLIQIGTLVLFQTDNIVIAKVLGPESVTRFNVSYKLFSVVIMVFTIVITPFWSSVTDAYTKQDFDWLKRCLVKINRFWLASSFVIVPLLVLFSGPVYVLWLGKAVAVSPVLSVCMGLYVIGYTWVMANCYFLNGFGKLRIQLILYAIVCVLNLPLAVYMGKTWGLPGIVLANVILLLVMGATLTIQSNKIVRGKATGLWNK